MELFLGLITGILFGFLLQKGEVLRFERQVGFLLLKDMTIIKFMLSAIAVGMVGLFLFHDLGLISFKVKGTVVGAQVIGGLLFGLGWGIAGYCPGTSVGAVGEGRLHAIWVVAGMLAGAALYAEAYPCMKQSVLTWGDLGKLTLPEIFRLNHWIVVAGMLAVILGLFSFFRKKGL